ncbi:MAG: SPASM domain-containing protein [Luteibaculaceae bacterium]
MGFFFTDCAVIHVFSQSNVDKIILGRFSFGYTVNFIRKLTPYKVINGVGNLLAYHVSRITKKPWQPFMPVSISVEPTTACNLGCPECPSGLKQFTRPTGNLKEDFFDSILQQLSKSLCNITFYFQGEPFINPKFLAMVKKASDKGIFTSTSTNAHFLHPELARKTVESGLDQMIISIDGTTQEVYEQYRIHGKLSKVLEGTRNMVQAKQELKSQTPHLIFQFLVVAPNEHQIKDVYQLADELGVDEVRLKSAQVYSYEDGNPLIPKNEKYARYRKLPNGKWVLKNKLLNQCWKMWHSCVLTWDGLVVPCCFDKDAQHQLGDTKETVFKTIWHGAQYKKFRQAILISRGEIDICKNCTEGTKVWVGDD